LWVRALATVAVLLPLSVAGVGVHEASFMLLMTPFGIAPADAFAMSLVILAYQFLLSGTGGAVELIGSLRSLRHAPASPAPVRRSPPSA
jgi:uncharacterized membrane protein YbhN (UPF0104 family)